MPDPEKASDMAYVKEFIKANLKHGTMLTGQGGSCKTSITLSAAIELLFGAEHVLHVAPYNKQTKGGKQLASKWNAGAQIDACTFHN